MLFAQFVSSWRARSLIGFCISCEKEEIHIFLNLAHPTHEAVSVVVFIGSRLYREISWFY